MSFGTKYKSDVIVVTLRQYVNLATNGSVGMFYNFFIDEEGRVLKKHIARLQKVDLSTFHWLLRFRSCYNQITFMSAFEFCKSLIF